jgi:hypothetical protein
VDPLPEPRPESRPRAREALVGAVAVAVVATVVVLASVIGIRHVRAAARVMAVNSVANRQAVEQKKTEQAASLVTTLASAVDSLARLKGGAGAEPVVPPAPSEFASPTACMLTYLPAIEMPDGALDFVCGETDLWAIEWKVRGQVVNRTGDGARLWNRLGRYSLGALASMRKGCCLDPPYLQAKVPGLWCGILRDTLRSFEAVPARANVHEFEKMLTCLEARGMHLPSHFAEAPPERARDAFTQFLDIARHRTSRRKR